MLVDWGISIRRACKVLRLDTSTYHYKSRRTDQAAVAKRIREICETRVRYGYRRVHVLLDREGWGINVKKVYRIYKELGMQLRHKTPKRRVKAKLREDRAPAIWPNDVWAMDFVHDQLATGRKLRILTVVDTYSRLSPVIDPRFSYRGEDVVATLEQACRKIGYPKTIRVDNGSEFISRDLDLWAYANNVTVDFSRPGKPTDNGFIEAFNGKLRAECLSERQIEVRDPTERGPLTFWLGLARASENHKGLVGTLRDRLGETAGPGPASSSREPDLAALLRAAIRLHQSR